MKKIFIPFLRLFVVIIVGILGILTGIEELIRFILSACGVYWLVTGEDPQKFVSRTFIGKYLSLAYNWVYSL